MSRYINFKDLKEDNVSLIGKRATILAKLHKSGYPVQKGIIVISKVFKEFLVESGITDSFFAFLKSGDYDNAQDLIINTDFPEHLKEEIVEAADKLKTECFTVSLSSPFDDEFGCYNIQKEKIAEWVQRCWAAMFAEDNAEQMRQNMYPSVIIQPHIEVQKAGIFYTINPAKMENNRMVVEIVSPRQHYYILDKKNGEVLNKNGTNTPFIQELPSITKISKDIEKFFRFPQKIDWIFNDKFFITNSRSLTERDKDHFLSQATSSLLKSRFSTS